MSTLKPDMHKVNVPPIDENQESSSIIDETRELADHAQRYYQTLRRNENPVMRAYRQNPYAVVAGVTGLGYLLAGGLFTPFTRRVLRMGMKALVVPLAATQIKNVANLGSDSQDDTSNATASA